VRVIWNGEGKMLFRKSGTEVKVPHFFLSALPKIPLEGELWCGRNSFENCLRLTKDAADSNLWNSVSFCVFDSPGMALPLEERIEVLQTLALPPNVTIVKLQKCQGKTHLQSTLDDITKQGGEGVVLRKPYSKYSDRGSWYKIKNFFDGEAIVLKSIPAGHKCKFYNGREFILPNIKTVDGIEGCVVVVRYTKLSSNGVPMSPIFHGIRTDLRWEDIQKQQILGDNS